MKKQIVLALTVASITVLSAVAFAAGNSGEAIFKTNCASCHPDGGNVMNKSETITGIKKPAKIIKKVRKGGGGMPAYDAKAISDADLKLLADYIIKTFKK